MAEALRVIFVHGVGSAHEKSGWEEYWRSSVEQALYQAGQADIDFDLQPLYFNDIFNEYPLGAPEYLKATGELIASWLKEAAMSAIGLRRGLGLSKEIEATAGMVARWTVHDGLRQDLRDRLNGLMDEMRPHLILGHSLGSLISYDTLLNRREGVDDVSLFTFGGQISHPAILNQWRAGRLEPLLHIRKWYHLYNRNDLVFTNRIPKNYPNAVAMEDAFGRWPFAHQGQPYLLHPMSIQSVWTDMVELHLAGADQRAVLESVQAPVRSFSKNVFVMSEPAQPVHKALHVGVDVYKDSSSNLNGCVNDAYAMSAAMQACGIPAENIRLVTNERATTAGILERVAWLLEDAKDGDIRVLSFSGHGTRLPIYGASGTVDQVMECLCPHDFNWALDTSITDRQLFDLYSQLDYGVRFLVFLDSCHSGGMKRLGRALIRSIDPPDDIRHRMLRWDEGRQMWLRRDMEDLGRKLSASDQQRTEMGWEQSVAQFVGSQGDTWRIGSALPLRDQKSTEYDAMREELGHFGPYMPVMLTACGEEELASEYFHGNISYGVFTYAVTTALRRMANEGRLALNYDNLVREAQQVLKEVGYDQNPEISGPTARRQEDIPFQGMSSSA